ncbi:t-SNARE [Piptocephalis cylindrospora]|uniref:t-SNARE n=1 Tax=Piptocephalis cylindrospora TaxID=1907219 RepID=A0A4P9XXU3_9FUNG|nr:t-SNARE [Piptocephalis cylindrospora]|eukprot:RKP11225.1 t-SNARE [Piptocephalis cylindrospora]
MASAAGGGSELFDNYQQEFSLLVGSLGDKVRSQIPNQIGDPRKATIRAAERELEEADEIIGQMEMEILNLSPSLKAQLQPRLRGHSADLEALRRELKRLIARGDGKGNRDELLARTDVDSLSHDQRDRLLGGTQRLQDSSRRLEESNRLALDTETLGIGILGDLRAQREQIQHTRSTLQEADSYVDRAQRTLKGMARRMVTNRLISIAIILVLVALIILVFYAKFVR